MRSSQNWSPSSLSVTPRPLCRCALHEINSEEPLSRMGNRGCLDLSNGRGVPDRGETPLKPELCNWIVNGLSRLGDGLLEDTPKPLLSPDSLSLQCWQLAAESFKCRAGSELPFFLGAPIWTKPKQRKRCFRHKFAKLGCPQKSDDPYSHRSRPPQ